MDLLFGKKRIRKIITQTENQMILGFQFGKMRISVLSSQTAYSSKMNRI